MPYIVSEFRLIDVKGLYINPIDVNVWRNIMNTLYVVIDIKDISRTTRISCILLGRLVKDFDQEGRGPVLQFMISSMSSNHENKASDFYCFNQGCGSGFYLDLDPTFKKKLDPGGFYSDPTLEKQSGSGSYLIST